jgi:acyl-CoA synthetase (AMP-forming)/AMP-acid ligase II
VGEVWIRAPNVIAGYWRSPDANAESFTDGWFRTGDVGYIGEGGLIYIVDRKKDVIIRGGENIYSAEVEAEIVAFPGVHDACVIVLPHPSLGEEVGALVLVTEAYHNQAFRDQLLAHLATRLARFKIPATLELTCTDFSRTATGKVIKADVLAQLTANEGVA